jgi:hypothetical protein
VLQIITLLQGQHHSLTYKPLHLPVSTPAAKGSSPYRRFAG